MPLSALAGLALLALVDSTSFGTLGVPVWMLSRARVRVAAVLTYLFTISALYWALGVALLLGAAPMLGWLAGAANRPVFDWLQLVVGVALLALSLRFDGSRAARSRTQREHTGGRRAGWLSRLSGPDARLRDVALVAVLAGLVEAASMLPYLGAIALLTSSTLAVPTQALVLVGYVVVMVLPALALLVTRLVAREVIEPLLGRVDAWVTRTSGAALGWVLGIIGFLIAADAAQRLLA